MHTSVEVPWCVWSLLSCPFFILVGSILLPVFVFVLFWVVFACFVPVSSSTAPSFVVR